MPVSFELSVGYVAPTVALWRGPSRTTIRQGAVDGDRVTFEWATQDVFSAYQVCVVPQGTYAHAYAIPIGDTYGSVNVAGSDGPYLPDSPIKTTITADDLAAIDDNEGARVIKVFVLSSAGYWSS